MGKISAVPIGNVPGEIVAEAAKMLGETGRLLSIEDIATLLSVRGIQVSEADLSAIRSHPLFVQAVSAASELRLFGEGKRAAVGLLVETVQDGAAPLHMRIRAAELIISRTMPPAAADPGAGAETDLAEMSAEDLRALVGSMESELAARAKPVRAPDSAPKSAKHLPAAAKNVFD